MFFVRIRFLSSGHYFRLPPFNVFNFTRKIYPYANQGFTQIPVGLIVPFLFDLLQGNLGTLVKFVLQDEDVGVGFQA